MIKFGLFIAFLGWVSSIEGYTIGHIAMIVIGLSIAVGDYYLARR